MDDYSGEELREAVSRSCDPRAYFEEESLDGEKWRKPLYRDGDYLFDSSGKISVPLKKHKPQKFTCLGIQ